MVQIYSPKDPEEVVTLWWDFGPLLTAGETITTPYWGIIDPEDPTVDTSALKSGDPYVGLGSQGNSRVFQQLVAGVDGTAYQHRPKILTSLGNVYVEKPTQLVTSGSPS